MEIVHKEKEDSLSIKNYIDLDLYDTVIFVNAGCDTSIPKNKARTAYFKITFLYNNIAMLVDKKFEEVGLTSNKAFLIGIKEALTIIKPNKKCKIIVPVALGFQSAEKYKGVNVNYIIEIKRLVLSKNLDITILELEKAVDEMKELYRQINCNISEYKLYKKIVNECIVVPSV